MDSFQRYELRRLEHQREEYEIVIHLADHLSEFADELGTLPREKKDVIVLAKQIVKERYPHIKVTMVKVIIGGFAITSLPLMGGNEASAQATAPVPAATQASQDGSIYYQVVAGDTLWNVSRKFNTTVDNVKRANQLTSDLLQLNQRIIIPKAFHTVGTGDYLTVLAKKYDTTVTAIKEANGLISDSTRLGQMLIIPVHMNGQANQMAPGASQQSKTSIYTVVAGDTLSAIAKRFGTTVEAILTSNNLPTDFLRIGQTLTLPTNATTNPAPDTTAPVPKQVPTRYTVVAGDSLSVIAKRFGTTVEALRSANHLTTDLLRIGQTLTLPTNATTNPAPDTTAPVPNQLPTSYTVVAGDSLSVIAKRFGTTVETLRSANNLTTDLLRIGQPLTIPTGTKATESAPAPTETQTPAASTNTEERTTFTYAVRTGDSLSVIAKNFGVTVNAIRSANNLSSDLLKVGQALTIPNGINAPAQTGANTITYTTHTVVSGDNIWDLSIRYGIPQSELLRANNMTATSKLSIGQKLTIPVHNIGAKSVVSERNGEYLDWRTEAQYVFPIGKTAKVTDFATGKSFYLKRTIGANHADSETVTINDTNIAKSIWGGFSWTPRAVILEIDGRKVAASMSFMPHERQYITNNGITGHFDVYFGNSTRHIDGRADASHQAQVERAAGLR
ncbi:LysM peptidoglycan-binding domain-containing protein [Bacillus sp. MRMR6]|uniref:LysM peptidoglycan-binding domain-containing protein n=1 Tax=Bacillus sp. MRMR6 TaxID=1928617 RepID=UPI0009FAA8BC|nr:LysM peptidoglycan-binding domain-containing protein [Bacillus sp. MRMR6]